jgi:hypothetical protein
MKRIIEDKLLRWKNLMRRTPLLIRGARQVGKTYSVEKFGREHFESVVSVDLERRRTCHQAFEGDLDVRVVLSQLEVFLEAKITPGKTLLFLDEIQACPRAIAALRYLYEDAPELHVIAAGSLLEFAFRSVSVPVGRVQFLEMHPMTFGEYLWAVGREQTAEVVLGEPRPLPEAIHGHLLNELRTYCFLGGMPGCVAAYVESGSLREAFEVQRRICDNYRQDFSKYAPRADPDCLQAIWQSSAQNVGQQVKFVRLANGHAGSTIRRAFDLLCMARVIRKVPAANPSGLPLGATASARRLKVLLLDIGLWQHLCGMRTDIEYAKADLLDVYRGAMAEQFVGQEMLVSQDSSLFYWSREARGSSAEVDYLAVVDGAIYPVEVKSGPAGRLRSMRLFLESFPNSPRGLVFSSGPYADLPEQKLTFVPLYFAGSATSARAEHGSAL